MKSFAPAEDHNDPVAYAKQLSKAIGKPVETRMGDLDDNELERVMDQINRNEGYKPGTVQIIPPGGTK